NNLRDGFLESLCEPFSATSLACATLLAAPRASGEYEGRCASGEFNRRPLGFRTSAATSTDMPVRAHRRGPGHLLETIVVCARAFQNEAGKGRRAAKRSKWRSSRSRLSTGR